MGGNSWCDDQGWGPINENGTSLVPCYLNTFLLGLPSTIAAVAFIMRASYLQRHGNPHRLGHIAAYWPSQIALVVAVFALAADLWTSTDYSRSGSYASLSLLIGWIYAIRLNRFESKYEIRSSSYIFFFELFSIFTAFINIYSINSQQDQDGEEDEESQKYFHLYFYSILMAFFFEALPRGRTHVQLQSSANAHDKANLFSRWFFHYIFPIISLGTKRGLTPNDIRDVMPERIETNNTYEKLSSNWEASKRSTEHKNASDGGKRTPNLILVIAKTFQWDLVIIVLTGLAASAIQFGQPYLIGKILEYIGSEDPNLPKMRGIILALGMFFVSITGSIMMGQHNKLVIEMELEVRNALVSMIYRKALVLSPGSRGKSTTGSITNHMSTDAEKWTKNLRWIPFYVTVPFEILVGTVMLYRILGWSVFCGLSTIILITPFQWWTAKFFDNAQEAKSKAMDSRVRLMGELLSNIKNIKMYGYEPAFKEKVEKYRAIEVDLLRKKGIVMSFLTIVFTCLPLFIAFVSFAVYASVGGPDFSRGDMSAKVVFVSLSIFGLLNRPVAVVDIVIECSIGLRVATRRIQRFLLREELDPNAVQRDQVLPKDETTPLVRIEDGTFTWTKKDSHDGEDSESEEEGENEEQTETTPLLSGNNSSATNNEPTLVDINLLVPRGSLSAIVGRVGQGKSSLLSAIIGDLYKLEGSVKVFGSIAYVPQQAWIINASIRDNIVFGKKFDQDKYDSVLFASGLLPDLEILAAGDQTEIGERGINLSGGQKQRVSLARAAYQDSDIYLLDDPLSAVDAHVEQHLWENLLGPKGLLKDKTRILSTHGINRLDQADQIIVMKNGRIAEAGCFSDLMSAKDTFYRLISEFSITSSKKKDSQTSSDDETESATVVDEDEKDEKDEDDEDEANGKLIETEGVKASIVGWDIFKVYCDAMSFRYVIITIVLFFVWEVFQQSVPIWLEHWIRVADTTNHSVFYFLGIYGALVISFILVDVYLTYVMNVLACIRASIVLHDSLLARILRLPMSFFDVTPQGRVLNRFSSDVSDIDEMIPEGYIHLTTCIANLIACLIFLIYATPAFILILPVAAVVMRICQVYYIKSSSMLRRLESISKSPLYQHFSETFNGISSIRAMGISDSFIKENAMRSDLSANAYFACSITTRWLNISLEGLTAFMVLFAALLAVLNKEKLSPSMAGLALSYTMTLTYNVIWTLRSYCDLSADLVAVERVHEYSNKRTEAPEYTSTRLPQNWPQNGKISFKNYSARYREGLDLVIKNVSFVAQPGERIGIVGRTGAGKSSLTLALFRIIEAANSYWARASAQEGLNEGVPSVDNLSNGGSIEIDGIDISTLGLCELRQHLSIIPQDPTLFSGTVRENLDPFGEASDAELWAALERAHLKQHISSLSNGLSFEVAQNGENFSVGQRSLICLARALLRKTKILVLDEATSAVDVETDKLIQKTIREEFQDRTVLTIAHRIKTIMDSDKILVLEKGQIQEYDTPSVLLGRKGLFYSLAEQAGEM